MKKLRVMIVDDSAVTRELLRHIIDSDERLEVVSLVESGEEALRVLGGVAPDVISMDIRLPGMSGLEATQRIMTERPTPIVVIAASVASDELNTGINALRAGALAVVEKPVGVSDPKFAKQAEHICTQLVIMSQVKVVRQRMPRVPGEVSSPAIPGVPRAGGEVAHSRHFRVLGIVASTGGPSALVKLLRGLWPQFPLPILLVQHITPCFLDGFVSWLATVCPFRISIASEGGIPEAGNIYVAPVDHHLKLENGSLRLDTSAQISFQRPSGTVLFQSLARSLGSRALGVLLTGMGDDGASGMKELRDAGGYTLAEDESTAVVYGMPAEAVRLGGVIESLPLQSIAPRIIELITDEVEIH